MMYVGVEIEFNIYKDGELYGDETGDMIRIINKDSGSSGIEAVHEYYSFMIEVLFMYPIVKLDDINKLVESLQNRYDVKIVYKTRNVCGDTTFNGLHLHTMCMPHIKPKYLEFVYENLKSSDRFLFSHHIWGGYSNSKNWRSWQRGRKYIPLNINIKSGKPPTFEVRAFNCYTLENDFKIIKGLYKSINILHDKNDDIILDGMFFSNYRNEIITNRDKGAV